MSNLSKKSTSRSKTAQPTPALSFIKDIHRQTRRQYTAEEKIRIVLEGLQGEQSVAEICPVMAFLTEGLNTNIYYRWIGRLKRLQVSITLWKSGLSDLARL